METLKAKVSDSPRTGTAREAVLTGINLTLQGGVLSTSFEIKTKDLQGEDLGLNELRSGNSVTAEPDKPGVVDKNLTARKAAEESLIKVIADSGLLKTIFELDIKIYEARQQTQNPAS